MFSPKLNDIKIHFSEVKKIVNSSSFNNNKEVLVLSGTLFMGPPLLYFEAICPICT